MLDSSDTSPQKNKFLNKSSDLKIGSFTKFDRQELGKGLEK